jgi:hypothetical protein
MQRKFEVGDKVKQYSENAQQWFTGNYRGLIDATTACVFWDYGIQGAAPIKELEPA